MSIGKLIKYHRTRLGFTQKQLASGICSISYLSKLENNSIEPSKEVLNLLANKLNITLDYNENEEHLIQQIYEWYQLMKNRNYMQAKAKLNVLKKRCDHSDNLEVRHLFMVMYFCYKITFDKKNLESIYKELTKMKDLFSDDALYYFYKFESLYFYYNNDLNSALTSLKLGEIIHKKLNFVDLELYYNLAIYYRRIHNIHKSTIYANTLLREAQANIDTKMACNAYLIIAVNLIRLGEYQEAEEILIKLHNNTEKLLPTFTSLILHNLGYIYFQWKDFENALHYYKSSLEHASNEADKIDTLYLMALIYLNTNDRNNFENTIYRGKQIASLNDNKKYIYKFFILENKMNNTITTDAFIKKLEKEIIPFFKKTGERNELMRNLKLLADILYQKHKYKKAAEYMMEINHLYKNTFGIEDY
jgi:HTH-type transcriptional regulator, quorum sensing regulator NprR